MGDGEEHAYSPTSLGAIESFLPLGRTSNFHWSYEEQGNTILFFFGCCFPEPLFVKQYEHRTDSKLKMCTYLLFSS